jgi:hypothetical protein
MQEAPTGADENPLVGFDWLLSTRPARENYDAQSGDTKMAIFGSNKGKSADVGFGMRNQNTTRAEFPYRENELRHRKPAPVPLPCNRFRGSGDIQSILIRRCGPR